MGRRLGSSVELSLSRALRGRLALFVEGQDLQLLSVLAETVGATRVAKRADFATVQMGGFTRNWLPTGFAEVISTLGSEVKIAVLLDSDLRSNSSLSAVKNRIVDAGVDVHIWVRRELENYVISPSALAVAASIPFPDAAVLLTDCIEALKQDTLTSIQAQRLLERKEPGSPTGALSEHSVLQNAVTEFENLWASEETQLAIVDAKVLINDLNRALQSRRAKTINPKKLAKALSAQQVPAEVSSYFQHLEDLLVGAISGAL